MSPRLQNVGLAGLGLVILALLASSVMGVAGKPSAAALAALPAGAVPEPPAGRPQFEVLNASGRPGLAKDVTHYLRERGFDVVNNGNARPADGTATRVLARTRDAGPAREVADSLHIPTVATQVDTMLQVAASVVLGRDWTMPGAAAPNPPSAAASSAPSPVDSAAPTAPAGPAKPSPVPARAPAVHRPTPPAAGPRAKPAPARHAAPAPAQPR